MRGVFLLLIGLLLATACAPREYLTPAGLAEIGARDPKLEMIRVYPSVTFISVYTRGLGQAYDIERSQGTLSRETHARRLEVPIGRTLRGAVLELERRPDRSILWVTFDPSCRERACAHGFAETEDGLYRLFSVPTIAEYEPPQVYRKRVSQRGRMKPSKVFSRSRSMPVYFTTKGLTASIALEIKRQERVEVETIKVESRGVPGEVLVEPAGPGAGEVER